MTTQQSLFLCAGLLIGGISTSGYALDTSSTLFNPDISVILDGAYLHSSNKEFALTGQTQTEHAEEHEHEHEHATEEGFNLNESEVAISAAVDQFADGKLILGFTPDGDIHIEEANIKTRMLPYGLQFKAGRLLSSIGYHNDQHSHVWNFNDISLPYQAFFGDEGLRDDGVQLTWLANLPFYTLIGAEILQGRQQELFGASDIKGSNITTAFVRISPNLTGNNALQLGGWTAHADHTQWNLLSEHDDASRQYMLVGSQLVYGLNAIYKWDSPKPLGAGDVKLVLELMRGQTQYDSVQQTLDDGSAVDEKTGSHNRVGYGLEASYGIAPRWQMALRVDGLNKTQYALADGFNLDTGAVTRYGLSLNFFPSEFSRVRLQMNHGRSAALYDLDRASTTDISISYNVSMGKHPAHAF